MSADGSRGRRASPAAGEEIQRPQDITKPKAKPELTDADKALLEAEPDWERMSQMAGRLLSQRSKTSGSGATKKSKHG